MSSTFLIKIFIDFYLTILYNFYTGCATYSSIIVPLSETINCFSRWRLHMTFREVEKILKANKWVLIRVSGSHYQYCKAGACNTVVVPNHSGHDLTIGVLKDLEKKTGLSLRR